MAQALKTGDTKRDEPCDWVDKYGNVLFRYAYARTSSRELSEDLVQDTFLAAMRSWDNFEGRSSVQTWLVSILKNKLIDHIRKASRREELSTSNDPDHDIDSHFNRLGLWNRIFGDWGRHPDEQLKQKQFVAAFADCLSKLPQRLRDAFTIRVLDKSAAADACKILDVSATNLGVLVHRARLQLRGCIERNWVNKQ